eukprot:COSAG06_NODE_38539_length_422_cov_1.049536_1_plen_52_part_10
MQDNVTSVVRTDRPALGVELYAHTGDDGGKKTFGFLSHLIYISKSSFYQDRL